VRVLTPISSANFDKYIRFYIVLFYVDWFYNSVGHFLRWGFALNACRVLQTCDAKEYALCSKSRTPAMDGCTAMLHMSDRALKLEEVAVGIPNNKTNEMH